MARIGSSLSVRPAAERVGSRSWDRSWIIVATVKLGSGGSEEDEGTGSLGWLGTGDVVGVAFEVDGRRPLREMRISAWADLVAKAAWESLERWRLWWVRGVMKPSASGMGRRKSGVSGERGVDVAWKRAANLVWKRAGDWLLKNPKELEGCLMLERFGWFVENVEKQRAGTE